VSSLVSARRVLFRSGTALSSCSLAVCTAIAMLAGPAAAESLGDALVKAYQFNPQLNAERARQRGTDENVPQALAGYRPQVVASLGVGLQAVRNLLPDNTIQGDTLHPWTIGVTVTQVLFNGFKTANSVRVAEFQVQSGREALRNVGQGVLLDAVTAYMNVIANEALLQAQQTNVAVLREILGTTHKRLDAGDVTPTDLAQAEARLNRGLADLNAADVALAISKATYTQVIGDPPSHLLPASPVDRLSPNGLAAPGCGRGRFRCRCRSNHDLGRGEQPAADRYCAGECQPVEGLGPDTQHIQYRSGLDPRADQCPDL
jgi:outer membrane protein